MSVIDVILEAKISPSAKETAAELVEAWIEQFHEFDAMFETVFVEGVWYLWLDDNTLAVGAMDRVVKDEVGLIGCEWKTTKEPKKTKAGVDTAWWNEDTWLEGIKNSPQLSIYGLALHRGTFVVPATQRTAAKRYELKVSNPRVLVRAAVKSSPVRFWPTDFADGVFGFPDEYLDGVVAPALLARAAGIRAMRASGHIPYALPGIHCVNKFHRVCPFFEKYCSVHEHPRVDGSLFDFNDPGSKAIALAGIDLHPDHPTRAYDEHPDLVIFSASSYQTALECDEKYRILTGITHDQDAAIELETGTGFHLGVAEFYREQISNDSRKVLLTNSITPVKKIGRKQKGRAK